MLQKVISGGQTGIEKIGLIAARNVGIPTGGTARVGWWTELGIDPTLQQNYGLDEAIGGSHLTANNILNSDGTVLFGEEESPDVILPLTLLRRHRKPYVINPTIEQLVAFILTQDIKVINVTGTVGSKLTEGEARLAMLVLQESFTEALQPKEH